MFSAGVQNSVVMPGSYALEPGFLVVSPAAKTAVVARPALNGAASSSAGKMLSAGTFAALAASSVLLAGCRTETLDAAQPALWAAASLAVGLPSLVAGAHILASRRSIVQALGWWTVAAVPILGPLLWFALGADPHVPTTADPGARFWHDRYRYLRPEPAQADEVPPFVPESFLPMLALSRDLARSPLLGGNAIAPLYNGEEAYPAMLEAIETEPAGGFVYVGKYIFESNATGRVFADALGRAQKRGVEVRVIVDRFGKYFTIPKLELISPKTWWQLLTQPSGLKILRRSGVAAEDFAPEASLRNGVPWNVIYHKKFMITSRTSFLGGINIGDTYYASRTDNPNRHNDIQYRIDGPVAREIEKVHREDWAFVTGRAAGEPTAPRLRAGEAYARVIRSAPDDSFRNFKKIVLGVLRHARQNVRIMTAYFFPDEELIAAMESAARSGVAVEIILSADNFIPISDWAARSRFRDLLRAGVRLRYQPPPFDHTKLIVADDFYVLFGSANLDTRSLNWHWEVGVEAYSKELARRMTAHFESVRDESQTVGVADVDSWPWHERLRNAVSALFGPLF